MPVVKLKQLVEEEITTFGRENKCRDVEHEIIWIYRENQEVKTDSPRCQICKPICTLTG